MSDNEMSQSYDVGVLIHFPGDVSEQVKLDLIGLAEQWHGYADGTWPFALALLPAGDFLAFIFSNPDNANLFISRGEKYLQAVNDDDDIDQLYSIAMCWTGLVGADHR